MSDFFSYEQFEIFKIFIMMIGYIILQLEKFECLKILISQKIFSLGLCAERLF